jgi:hypothetical protein
MSAWQWICILYGFSRYIVFWKNSSNESMHGMFLAENVFGN